MRDTKLENIEPWDKAIIEPTITDFALPDPWPHRWRIFWHHVFTVLFFLFSMAAVVTQYVSSAMIGAMLNTVLTIRVLRTIRSLAKWTSTGRRLCSTIHKWYFGCFLSGILVLSIRVILYHIQESWSHSSRRISLHSGDGSFPIHRSSRRLKDNDYRDASFSDNHANHNAHLCSYRRFFHLPRMWPNDSQNHHVFSTLLSSHPLVRWCLSFLLWHRRSSYRSCSDYLRGFDELD